MVLGLWYRLHDQREEAKACFKAIILEGIAILADDDPTNDIWGYASLAQTLLMAGDKTNAATAFALTNAPLDMLKRRRDAEPRAAEKLASEEHVTGGAMEVKGTETETAKDSTTMTVTLPIDSAASNGPLKATGTPEVGEKTGNGAAKDTEVNDTAETDKKDNEDYMDVFQWNCDGQCQRKVEDWNGNLLLRDLPGHLFLRRMHRTCQNEEAAFPKMRRGAYILPGLSC